MGIQSSEIKSIFSLKEDSNNYLKKMAEKEYFQKHFLFDNCFKGDERNTKYNYIINKYFEDEDCTVVAYLDKKLSGELDNEYRKRKILQKLDRLEFSWECYDIYENKDCNDWKAIKW